MSKKPSRKFPVSTKSKVVVYKEETRTTTTLTLTGPTTFQEGQALASTLNTLIAQYNTLFALKPDGTFGPKITAETDQPE